MVKIREWHGMSGTKVYYTWSDMLHRCRSAKHKHYRNWGGRGITVCERWQQSFLAFLEDMGLPEPGQSIDRIDNDGNYEPGNCRWASVSEQLNNTRRTHFITRDGRSQSIAQWARELGVKPPTIHKRLGRGLSELEAISMARGARKEKTE